MIQLLDNSTFNRAQALRAIVEQDEFANNEFNGNFVLMQYFGYLRRDPDVAGYNFWLNKLNVLQWQLCKRRDG